MANIIPGNSIALEGMPADELLAGIVCLSPTLLGSLGDAVVAHVVGSMEDGYLERLDIMQHFFPKGHLSWLSLKLIVKATLWTWQGSGEEHKTGGEGAGHNF